jgi:acyl-CoA thioesterase I
LSAASRRVLCALLLAGTALAGCGGGGGAAPPPPPPPPPSTPPLVAPGAWVVLGSSSAAGVGASAGQGWVDLLAAAQAGRTVTLHNLARGGLLSPQALPSGTVPPAGRPAPDAAVNISRALGFTPRLVILSFPSNDAAAGYSGEETAANLLAIQAAAQAASAATLVLGSQPRDALSAAQRAAQTDADNRVAARLGACFVPLQPALADVQGRIAAVYSAGDGIHLNDAGHREVLQQVQAALASGRCVRLAAP